MAYSKRMTDLKIEQKVSFITSAILSLISAQCQHYIYVSLLHQCFYRIMVQCNNVLLQAHQRQMVLITSLRLKQELSLSKKHTWERFWDSLPFGDEEQRFCITKISIRAVSTLACSCNIRGVSLYVTDRWIDRLCLQYIYKYKCSCNNPCIAISKTDTVLHITDIYRSFT